MTLATTSVSPDAYVPKTTRIAADSQAHIQWIKFVDVWLDLKSKVAAQPAKIRRVVKLGPGDRSVNFALEDMERVEEGGVALTEALSSEGYHVGTHVAQRVSGTWLSRHGRVIFPAPCLTKHKTKPTSCNQNERDGY